MFFLPCLLYHHAAFAFLAGAITYFLIKKAPVQNRQSIGHMRFP